MDAQHDKDAVPLLGEGTQPAVSIIIVNWNTGSLLRRCLTSIEATAAKERTEVIVIDNASIDESPRLVRDEFPQVTLLEQVANHGFSRSANAAIGGAAGEFILVCHPDIEFQKNTVVGMRDFYPFGAIRGAGCCWNSRARLLGVYCDRCLHYARVSLVHWTSTGGTINRLATPR
jgi:glycosyltransferase involved in cell wall biosynthesis